MRLRSLLFVPGDRPDRFDKAMTSGADAVILDLEDAVVPARKDAARQAVASFLAAQARSGEKGAAAGGPAVFVRINPLDLAMVDADLAAAKGADGIVLPKAEGASSLAALDRLLGAERAVILPIATETPAAVFQLGSYGGVTARLCGLTWGAEDLPAAIGAATSREPDGSLTDPYRMVRALALFAAHAAGVAAIETVHPDIKDMAGLEGTAQRAARDGFSGMMAIHPAQVALINAAFTPTAAAVAEAQAIVDAFAAHPEAGALQVNGRMADAPHLKQAKRVLARAGKGGAA
ncbi:CoA ester lyase [Aurantimonas sp. VKM B-3413]|uniref:HpcH/HpaI aldolase/citrate lyase family protein n=1 Tax=Aurantimonas sp. VKM B-3413 TaxID=2779401 RepID=UPI001E5CE80C|nr:CoA ester lyase [Aurantimonas sp. VKM B-3413]MCB8837573.1 CoA ester lyase [Aurantimonas sp. VKM B-3413]